MQDQYNPKTFPPDTGNGQQQTGYNSDPFAQMPPQTAGTQNMQPWEIPIPPPPPGGNPWDPPVDYNYNQQYGGSYQPQPYQPQPYQPQPYPGEMPQYQQQAYPSVSASQFNTNIDPLSQKQLTENMLPEDTQANTSFDKDAIQKKGQSPILCFGLLCCCCCATVGGIVFLILSLSGVLTQLPITLKLITDANWELEYQSNKQGGGYYSDVYSDSVSYIAGIQMKNANIYIHRDKKEGKLDTEIPWTHGFGCTGPVVKYLYNLLEDKLELKEPMMSSNETEQQTPDKALDGNIETIAHTEGHQQGQTNEFWAAKFDRAEVTRVMITNRKGCCGERLQSAEVYILEADVIGELVPKPQFLCGQLPLVTLDANVYEVKCKNLLKGNIVKIIKGKDSDSLNLAEVEVYGRECVYRNYQNLCQSKSQLYDDQSTSKQKLEKQGQSCQYYVQELQIDWMEKWISSKFCCMGIMSSTWPYSTDDGELQSVSLHETTSQEFVHWDQNEEQISAKSFIPIFLREQDEKPIRYVSEMENFNQLFQNVDRRQLWNIGFECQGTMITNFNNPTDQTSVLTAQNYYFSTMNADICHNLCQNYDNVNIKFGTCCNFQVNRISQDYVQGVCTIHAGTEVQFTTYSASLINIDGIIKIMEKTNEKFPSSKMKTPTICEEQYINNDLSQVDDLWQQWNNQDRLATYDEVEDYMRRNDEYFPRKYNADWTPVTHIFQPGFDNVYVQLDWINVSNMNRGQEVSYAGQLLSDYYQRQQVELQQVAPPWATDCQKGVSPSWCITDPWNCDNNNQCQVVVCYTDLTQIQYNYWKEGFKPIKKLSLPDVNPGKTTMDLTG